MIDPCDMKLGVVIIGPSGVPVVVRVIDAWHSDSERDRVKVETEYGFQTSDSTSPVVLDWYWVGRRALRGFELREE